MLTFILVAAILVNSVQSQLGYCDSESGSNCCCAMTRCNRVVNYCDSCFSFSGACGLFFSSIVCLFMLCCVMALTFLLLLLSSRLRLSILVPRSSRMLHWWHDLRDRVSTRYVYYACSTLRVFMEWMVRLWFNDGHADPLSYDHKISKRRWYAMSRSRDQKLQSWLRVQMGRLEYVQRADGQAKS